MTDQPVETLTISRTGEAGYSQLLVRQVTQKDLPALEWDGEYRHFRRLYRDIFQTARQGKAVLWVGDLENVGVIGQVFVQLDSARKELADGISRAYIYGFRVRSNYRRLGVGKCMLQTVEYDLRQRAFQYVTLNVGRENLDARRFYERYNFQVVAAEPGRWSFLDEHGNRHEVHEPAWRMEKQLARY